MALVESVVLESESEKYHTHDYACAASNNVPGHYRYSNKSSCISLRLQSLLRGLACIANCTHALPLAIDERITPERLLLWEN